MDAADGWFIERLRALPRRRRLEEILLDRRVRELDLSPPAVGQLLLLDQGCFRVQRVGRSPFPHDRRPRLFPRARLALAVAVDALALLELAQRGRDGKRIHCVLRTGLLDGRRDRGRLEAAVEPAGELVEPREKSHRGAR